MTITTPTQNNDWIDLKEASQISGKSIKTLRRKAKEGELSFKMVRGKFGNEIRLHKNQLLTLSNAALEALPTDQWTDQWSKGQRSVQSGQMTTGQSNGQAMPTQESIKNQEKIPLDSSGHSRVGDDLLQKLLSEKDKQLQEARQRETKIVEDKDRLYALVGIFQQRMFNLESETKLLSEGKEKVVREKTELQASYEQEKNSLIQSHEEDKKKLTGEYEKKIRRKKITIALLSITFGLLVLASLVTFLFFSGILKVDTTAFMGKKLASENHVDFHNTL